MLSPEHYPGVARHCHTHPDRHLSVAETNSILAAKNKVPIFQGIHVDTCNLEMVTAMKSGLAGKARALTLVKPIFVTASTSMSTSRQLTHGEATLFSKSLQMHVGIHGLVSGSDRQTAS
jgi:hypothetical protein